MSESGGDLREQLVGFFFEESSEGLEIIENGLVSIDVAEPSDEDINSIFRAMHSIKGASGSFGFTAISEFAHSAETLLDEVRASQRALTQELVDVLLRATDCLGAMIHALGDGAELDASSAAQVQAEIEALLTTNDEAPAAELGHEDPVGDDSSSVRALKISFHPHRGLLRTGNDPVRILRELAGLGEMAVQCDVSAIPAFGDLDPEDCFLRFDAELETEVDDAEINEVFSWVEDDCDLSIEAARASTATEAVAALSSESDPEDGSTVPAGSPAPPDGGAKAGSDSAPAGAKDDKPRAAQSSIRVSTDKVDDLINMVGELVITQSMLGEIGAKFEMSDVERLREGLGQLQRNTRELQETVMKIRMLPISVTFARFPRLVRDISQQLGKQIELVMEGEGTELDKNVLEQIGDPLVHLIRNSLDHGLESPEERIEAGKSEVGTIKLNASHLGGCIVIEVSDDGRGLDVEAIRRKALKQGLIAEDEVVDDRRAAQLILQPGFSTKEEVTDVSGRGVGMDVVVKNIKALGGAIDIESRPSEGSTTTIRLPLTLAILDGQLVRVGSEIYIVPLVSIVESLQIKLDQINSIAGRVDVYRLRDEAIPIIRLYELFSVEPDRRELDRGLLMVVEGGNGRKAGLVVDELLAQQQVVIKSLESNYEAVEGLSGATILGDGTVALIVDIAGLLQFARDTQGYSSGGILERDALAAASASELAAEPVDAGAEELAADAGGPDLDDQSVADDEGGDEKEPVCESPEERESTTWQGEAP